MVTSEKGDAALEALKNVYFSIDELRKTHPDEFIFFNKMDQLGMEKAALLTEKTALFTECREILGGGIVDFSSRVSAVSYFSPE